MNIYGEVGRLGEFSGMAENFRGAGKYYGKIKMHLSILHLRGVCFVLHMSIYGEGTIVFGVIEFSIKILLAILNFCGILPQTDRHNGPP